MTIPGTTLHDVDFQHDEIAGCMRLLLRGDSTQVERMRILKQQQDRTLDEITRAAAETPG